MILDSTLPTGLYYIFSMDLAELQLPGRCCNVVLKKAGHGSTAITQHSNIQTFKIIISTPTWAVEQRLASKKQTNIQTNKIKRLSPRSKVS